MKILRNLPPPRAHRHQHGDVSRAVGHRHRQHHQNIQSRDERDQPDEKRGHQFFKAQRAEERAVFVHPRRRVKPLPAPAAEDRPPPCARRRDSSLALRAGSPRRPLPASACGRLQRHESPVRVVIVKSRIENSRHPKSPRARQHPEGRQVPLRARQRHVIARGDSQFSARMRPTSSAGMPSASGAKLSEPATMCRSAPLARSSSVRVDALQHHAARTAAERKQHGVVNRGLDRAHAGRSAELRHQRAIIADSSGARAASDSRARSR